MHSILRLASNNSFWNGIDIYHLQRVKSHRFVQKDLYEGEVEGSRGEIYHVSMNLKRPRASTCDCAFAKDRRVICKHMVAMFFACFPEEEKVVMDEIDHQHEIYLNEQENELQKRKENIEKYVKSLTKKELQEQLIRLLIKDLETQR